MSPAFKTKLLPLIAVSRAVTADNFLASTHREAPHDAAKVARLRAAIASGAYEIDPGAIADAMIRVGGASGLAACQFSDSMEPSEN